MKKIIQQHLSNSVKILQKNYQEDESKLELEENDNPKKQNTIDALITLIRGYEKILDKEKNDSLVDKFEIINLQDFIDRKSEYLEMVIQKNGKEYKRKEGWGLTESDVNKYLQEIGQMDDPLSGLGDLMIIKNEEVMSVCCKKSIGGESISFQVKAPDILTNRHNAQFKIEKRINNPNSLIQLNLEVEKDASVSFRYGLFHNKATQEFERFYDEASLAEIMPDGNLGKDNWQIIEKFLENKIRMSIYDRDTDRFGKYGLAHINYPDAHLLRKLDEKIKNLELEKEKAKEDLENEQEKLKEAQEFIDLQISTSEKSDELLRQLEEELTGLEGENKDQESEKQIEEFNLDCKKKQEDLAEAQKKNLEQQDLIEKLQEDYKDITALLSSSKFQKEYLEQKRSEDRDLLEFAEAENKITQEELDIKRVKEEDLQKENRFLIEKSEEFEIRKRQLEAKILILEEDASENKDLLKFIEEENALLKEELDKTDLAEEELKKELNLIDFELSKKQEKYEDTLSELKKQEDELVKQNKSLNNNLQKTKEEKEDSDQKSQDLQESLSDIKQKIDNLQKSWQAKVKLLESAENKKDILTGKLEQLKESEKALSEELKEKKEKIGRLGDNRKFFKTQSIKLAQQLGESRADKLIAMKRRAEAENRCVKAVSEIDQLKKENKKDNQRHIAIENKLIKRFKAQADEAMKTQNMLKSKKQQVKKLTEELDEQKNKAKKNNREKRNLKKNNEKLIKSEYKLKKDKEKLRGGNRDLKAEVKDLKKECRRLTKVIGKHEQTIDILNRKLDRRVKTKSPSKSRKSHHPIKQRIEPKPIARSVGRFYATNNINSSKTKQQNNHQDNSGALRESFDHDITLNINHKIKKGEALAQQLMNPFRYGKENENPENKNFWDTLDSDPTRNLIDQFLEIETEVREKIAQYKSDPKKIANYLWMQQ